MSKKKRSQKRMFGELKNQLLTQAEKLGIRDDYNPIALEELKLDALKKMLTEFYMEKSNLEYELNVFGSDKRELLIKLERLNSYLRKAEGLHAKHLKGLGQKIARGMGDIERTRQAVNRIDPVRIRAAA